MADLLDRPLIISVYMKNNTPGCDRQVKSLTDFAPQLAAAGYNVLAVSRDGIKSHAKYAEKIGIPYILASDPESLVSKAADSIIPKKMYGRSYEGPARAAFVIGTDATVLAVVESVDTKAHGEEILRLIESFSSNPA